MEAQETIAVPALSVGNGSTAGDEVPPPPPPPPPSSSWNVLEQQAAALVPEGLKSLSLPLYLTFWSLGLPDLEAPVQK
jgi:hypothetical protein